MHYIRIPSGPGKIFLYSAYSYVVYDLYAIFEIRYTGVGKIFLYSMIFLCSIFLYSVSTVVDAVAFQNFSSLPLQYILPVIGYLYI